MLPFEFTLHLCISRLRGAAGSSSGLSRVKYLLPDFGGCLPKAAVMACFGCPAVLPAGSTAASKPSPQGQLPVSRAVSRGSRIVQRTIIDIVMRFQCCSLRQVPG